MKIKTSELTGAALDWAAAKCEGYEPVFNPVFNGRIRYGWYDSAIGHTIKKYSTNWSQGGPIIEREIARLEDLGDEGWEACGYGFTATGPTPLIAIMRCYVASKLGDEVDVPNELC